MYTVHVYAATRRNEHSIAILECLAECVAALSVVKILLEGRFAVEVSCPRDRYY